MRHDAKCEAPQTTDCAYAPTHLAEYYTGKTGLVAGEQEPVTRRIPVCGACVDSVPNLHRVQLLAATR